MPDSIAIATFTLTLNECGDVMLLQDSGSTNLGGKEVACAEICRFLAEIDWVTFEPTLPVESQLSDPG